MAALTQDSFIPLVPAVMDKTGQTVVDVQETPYTSIETDNLSTANTETASLIQETKLSVEHHKYLSPLISERAVDQPRPLKVIYIGAGVSGILAAINFRKTVPNLDLAIYEKNPEIGGTWYENKYPGCACGKWQPRGTTEQASDIDLIDVPSHSYQLSFDSWTGWSKFFSGAPEILEYWKRVAQKYDVRKHVKFQSRCVGARWNDSLGKWFVQILNTETGETFEDSADVFMTGTGLLNEWKWPSIPGIQSFKGQLLHSACWDETFESEVTCSSPLTPFSTCFSSLTLA